MAAPAGADALVAQLERAEAAALHCADASAPASAAQDGLAALEALLGADVDAELLAATGLGKRVRKLAKAGEAAGAAAMSLADKARQVMDAWVAKVKAATPADDAAAAEPAAKRAKGEPASEPPRAAAAAVKRETLAPPPPTKDPARDKLRELLTTALELAAGEGVEGHPAGVAAAVEAAMFKEYGGAASKDYKAKFRQLSFNLKDPKNPDLRRSVLSGETEPAELLKMDAEELGSCERRKANQQIREHALWECERGQAAMASTDQFQCGKCKQRKCTYFQMQTRSADEPMTTFVQCVACGNRWKFC